MKSDSITAVFCLWWCVLIIFLVYFPANFFISWLIVYCTFPIVTPESLTSCKYLESMKSCHPSLASYPLEWEKISLSNKIDFPLDSELWSTVCHTVGISSAVEIRSGNKKREERRKICTVCQQLPVHLIQRTLDKYLHQATVALKNSAIKTLLLNSFEFNRSSWQSRFMFLIQHLY